MAAADPQRGFEAVEHVHDLFRHFGVPKRGTPGRACDPTGSKAPAMDALRKMV